eukprot:SAG11_NODE_32729_length_281_cov_0.851648_1_plen_82_part_01
MRNALAAATSKKSEFELSLQWCGVQEKNIWGWHQYVCISKSIFRKWGDEEQDRRAGMSHGGVIQLARVYKIFHQFSYAWAEA